MEQMIVEEGLNQPICDLILNGLEAFNYSYFQARSIDMEQFVVYTKDETGKVIAGVCGASMKGGKEGPWIEISFAWVDEPLRRQGLGRRLFLRLEEFAHSKNCNYMQVFTWAYQAVGFYEKLGFTQVGSIPNWIEGHDAIFFRKHLK